MVDLVFMEKIARWLTNTKVKIKAEVAASNTAAKNIADALARLEQRLDACEKPTPDKEVSSMDILFIFLFVITMLLNCSNCSDPFVLDNLFIYLANLLELRSG